MSETAQKIRNVDYDLPRDLSLEARQCLKSILTKDLQERYTPPKILKTLLFTSYGHKNYTKKIYFFQYMTILL